PCIRIIRQQARMTLRDMEHDSARLEQHEIAVFIGWNLSERMQRAMRGFFHVVERNKTNVVRLADFFECPAHAHVARQSPAAIGRLFEGSDNGAHKELLSGFFVSRGRTTGRLPDSVQIFFSRIAVERSSADASPFTEASRLEAEVCAFSQARAHHYGQRRA